MRYATYAEATDVIIEAIESSGATAANFDIDAIADETICRADGVYVFIVDRDDLWVAIRGNEF